MSTASEGVASGAHIFPTLTTWPRSAERLKAHPSVTLVRYPGLASHPGRSVAARQMNGFGTILSFEVAGGAAAADAVCEGVRLAVHGTSVGGVETLLERRAKWPGEETTPEGLIRLSVGLEHVDDLWADLEQALDRAISVVSQPNTAQSSSTATTAKAAATST